MDAWLPQADLADDLVTLSNQTMMAVLEPDAETLVQETQSKIWRPKCHQDFPRVNRGRPLNDRRQKRCGGSHQIYYRAAI